MIFSKVNIKNYRSIKNEEILVESIANKNCFIFFGKNGAGKSNLLKAIRLLDFKQTVNYNIDCEKQAFKSLDDIEIKFSFILSDDEMGKILKELKAPTEFLKDLTNSTLIIHKIVSKDSKVNTKYEFLTNTEFNYKKFGYSNEQKTIFLNSVSEGFEDRVALTNELLDQIIKPHIANNIDLIKKLIPKILYWVSKDEYLINKPINLDNFKADKNTSIPLRNMFKLSSINDDAINHRIDYAKSSSEGKIELEKEISENTTNYINKLWPEHQISFALRIEGNTCTVSICDKDNDKSYFKMEQRSDGFKHFMSILLTLSAENNSNTLKNNIILIDEPENSLHPSSIRYLREELLNISIANFVFISSHSIYFVDKMNINRHYKVFKENGISNFSQLSSDNPLQEEIIYEALGTSIYELIEPNIIIFEGTTDKDLFDAITNRFKKKIKPAKIKTISAGSASKIKTYTKFFNNNSVNGFVVVDSDSDGRSAKKNIIEEDSSYQGSIYELSELTNITKNNFALEDLYPEELIKDTVNELYGFIPTINGIDPILKDIFAQIRSLKIRADGKLKELKSLLVKKVISDFYTDSITQKELIEKYNHCYDFVINLHRKIN